MYFCLGLEVEGLESLNGPCGETVVFACCRQSYSLTIDVEEVIYDAALLAHLCLKIRDFSLQELYGGKKCCIITTT